MITNITLENFKCFRHVSINPKLLTVLIGPNGTGKSSILQALLLLKQSVGESALICHGALIDFEDASEIFPKFQTVSSPVSIAFEGIDDYSEARYRGSFSPTLQLMRGNSLPYSGNPAGLLLSKLRFVAAARGFVRIKYPLGHDGTQDIPISKGLGEAEEQVATNLVYGGPLDRISELMEDVTETGIRADMVTGRTVVVRSLTSQGSVNMVSEGFGTNSLILLFHQVLNAKRGATVLIEEPEIHLHPKAQAELAEVLAETAKAEDKQIIMTTHSEHIAGRLLTLVAEQRLTTDELAIYSFEKDEKGECSATEIEVTDLGQTEGGLTGFFDNNLAEMDRYVKALQGRS